MIIVIVIYGMWIWHESTTGFSFSWVYFVFNSLKQNLGFWLDLHFAFSAHEFNFKANYSQPGGQQEQIINHANSVSLASKAKRCSIIAGPVSQQSTGEQQETK